MSLQTQQSIAKTDTHASTRAVNLKCTVAGCDRHYSRADSLREHIRVAHGENVSKKKSRFTCPVVECNKTYFHATQLINHLSEHNIKVGKLHKNFFNLFIKLILFCMMYSVTETLEFQDWSAFLQWKSKEELRTFISYTKPKGTTCKGSSPDLCMPTYIAYEWIIGIMH